LTIEANFPIFKVSERVFKLNNFNIDSKYSSDFFNLLDYGLKFSLCFFKNRYYFFNYFINNIDSSLYNFNKFLFFSKRNLSNNSKQDPSSNIDNITKRKDKNESFMDHLKSNYLKNNISNNIPLQHETLMLKRFMFESLANVSFNNQQNLSKKEIELLYDFISEKPFIIVSCDKNVGFAILEKSLYINLANEHLNSNNRLYKKLTDNPLKITKKKIDCSLLNLNNHNHISDKLFKFLKMSKVKLGKFKIMPKIHKPKFGIRPIVASIKHPTSMLSLLIDLILQEFIVDNETCLKDSQNLIQNCIGIFLDKDTELYSCDFESLYTNINSEHAINLITEFLSKKFKSINIDIIAINTILKLILSNNIFEFDNEYYIQLDGVAMGCKCGPSLANIYLYILEINWLNTIRPIIYYRFIDDIFIAFKGKLDVNSLKDLFGNLKLNIVNNKSVIFLDLVLSINDITNKLDFSLYIKETNTFQYVPSNSNHPNYIFRNIPFNLFLRIKRICSSFIDFLYHSRNLFVNLLKRGYDYKSLKKSFLIVAKIDRDSLIKYKNKENKKELNVLRLNMTFDHNYLSLKADTLYNFYLIKNYYTWLNKFKLAFSNTIMPNMKKIFIDNFDMKKFNKNFFTFKCNFTHCQVCPYILSVSHLYLNNFILPLKNNCCCINKKVVYIIKCMKCNCFYIGETGEYAYVRINQHIKSIVNFQPYKNNTFLPVAEHFRLKGHILFNHFRFCIFNKNLEKSKRLSTEIDIINIFRQFTNTLNIKPDANKFNFNLVKSLSFK